MQVREDTAGGHAAGGDILQVVLHTVQIGGLKLRHTHRCLRPALCLFVTQACPAMGKKERVVFLTLDLASPLG